MLGTKIKRFLHNISWLLLLQGLGYFFSFLTLPVLISKFGYEKIGIVFTIQAILLTISGLSNYSLIYYIPTQSKKISSDKNYLLSLWHLSVTVKLYLSVIFLAISLVIVWLKFTEYFNIWLLSSVITLPKIVQPTLFYNALEKNKNILLIGFLSKLIFLVFIIFISNYIWINFVFGISEFLVILFFLKNEKWHIKLVSFTRIIHFLKQTFTLFLINLFSILKPASILPLIAFLFGNSMVTTYTLADKIINIFRGISGASYVSFYPILNKSEQKSNFIQKKNIYIVFVFTFLIVGFIWVFAQQFIYILNDFNPNPIAVAILRILSFSIPVSFTLIPLFSNLLEIKKWKTIVFLSFLQLLIFGFSVLFFHQNIFQITYSIVLSEVMMLIGYLYFVNRNNTFKKK